MTGCPIGGGPAPAAWSDYINGEVRLDQTPMQALPYLRRSVAAGRRIDNRLIVGVAGLSAVSAEARVGDPAIALAQYGELIDHWHRDGAWNMQWATLRTLIGCRQDADRGLALAIELAARARSANSTNPVLRLPPACCTTSAC
jgi:hypothetical protein